VLHLIITSGVNNKLA